MYDKNTAINQVMKFFAIYKGIGREQLIEQFSF